MDQQTPPPIPDTQQTNSPAKPVPSVEPPAGSPVAIQPNADAAKARLENRRALAIALMAGAFPAITAIGGAVWSLADKRPSNNFIWIGLVAAVALLFMSIYCGGRGIASLHDASSTKPKWFNRQALYGLAGMICAVLSLGMWLRVPSKPSSEMEALTKELDALRERIATTEKRQENDIAAIRAEIAKTSQHVQQSNQTKQSVRSHP